MRIAPHPTITAPLSASRPDAGVRFGAGSLDSFGDNLDLDLYRLNQKRSPWPRVRKQRSHRRQTMLKWATTLGVGTPLMLLLGGEHTLIQIPHNPLLALIPLLVGSSAVKVGQAAFPTKDRTERRIDATIQKVEEGQAGIAETREQCDIKTRMNVVELEHYMEKLQERYPDPTVIPDDEWENLQIKLMEMGLNIQTIEDIGGMIDQRLEALWQEGQQSIRDLHELALNHQRRKDGVV